jgi:hypothetical protein
MSVRFKTKLSLLTMPLRAHSILAKRLSARLRQTL